MYYNNQPQGPGYSQAYGQIMDAANQRYTDASPPQQQLSQNSKDPNLHKVQTKNRYAQSELLKKTQNNQNGAQQKSYIKTEQSLHKPGSKMSRKPDSVSPNDRQRKQPGIIAQQQLDGGQLTPRKLIINNILMNIANNQFETKIDYYKVGKVIGKGAFGKVNLAINRLTGKFVALKSINKTYMTDESSLKKIM